MKITAELIERIACTGYEAKRGYEFSCGGVVGTTWQITPEETKQLYRGCAQRVLLQPEVTVEELHESWRAAKSAEGWTWAAEYSSAAKQHPWLLPFPDLKPAMRLQYRMFKGIVEAFRGEFLGQQELKL